MKSEGRYYTLEPGESQYDGLETDGFVDARYVHAEKEKNAGNKLIECIPPPLEGDHTIRRYMNPIPPFDFSEATTRRGKIASILGLRDVRFFLPFHQDIEDELYNAAVESYSRRDQIEVEDARTKCIIKGQEVVPSSVLFGDSGRGVFGKCSILGASGSGKTSGLETWMQRVPQVYVHHDARGITTQILYLHVTCHPHGNLSAFYEGVGAAADHALHNTYHDFKTKVARARGRGGKAQAVEDIIELFSVGLIIVDEAEMLDLSPRGDSESQFDSLLTIMDDTGVSMCFVGCEDVFDKLFVDFRGSRRAGRVINASDYCTDKEHFARLVRALFTYQAFDHYVAPTPDIIDALYECSLGTVDHLVTLYSRMCLDYIDCKTKPKVDGRYVRYVAKKYYPGIDRLIREGNIEEMYEINMRVKREIDEIYGAEKEEHKKEMAARSEEIMEERFVHDNVIDSVRTYTKFNIDEIESAYRRVSVRTGDISVTTLTQEVIEELYEKGNSKKRRSTKPPANHIDTSHVQEFAKKGDAI